jgi:hypothetical protein
MTCSFQLYRCLQTLSPIPVQFLVWPIVFAGPWRQPVRTRVNVVLGAEIAELCTIRVLEPAALAMPVAVAQPASCLDHEGKEK